MKYTTLSQVSGLFRTRTIIKSRIQRIQYHVDNIDQSKYPFNQANVLDDLEYLKNMVLRLDNNTLITTNQVFNIFGSTAEHLKNLFGVNYKIEKNSEDHDHISQILTKLMEKFRMSTRNARIKELQYRMRLELELAFENKEYTIFNTLTVSDKYYDAVFNTKSNKHWNSYMRQWSRITKNHRYFAVIERGSKTGRLHIHVLHIFSHIRKGLLIDPNRNRDIPKYREINQLKCLWQCGTSSPIAVRFAQNDIFGLNNWRWPVEINKSTKNYQPISVKPPQALASYMTKYVLKNYQTTKEKFPWRTRMSRNFGQQMTSLIVSKANSKTLRALMKIPSLINNPSNKTERIIPPKMIERQATREWIRRKQKTNPKLLQRIYRMLKPRPSLKQQLTTLITRKPNLNSLNTTYSLTETLMKTVAFELRLLKLNTEWHLFPNDNTIKVMGVTQRGYA